MLTVEVSISLHAVSTVKSTRVIETLHAQPAHQVIHGLDKDDVRHTNNHQVVIVTLKSIMELVQSRFFHQNTHHSELLTFTLWSL